METINRKVILSTTMLLECGNWQMRRIDLDQAKAFAQVAENFVGHDTVRLLGIEPVTERHVCKGYDEALVIKVRGRLSGYCEHSLEEIKAQGYDIFLITRL
ncbi:MAG: hypothetical protein ACKKL5_01690 [Candidatus Komeilibacteria bacterium]